MKDLEEKAGLESRFHIEPATGTGEIDNPAYSPARRKLAEYGINCAGKTAYSPKTAAVTSTTS